MSNLDFINEASHGSGTSGKAQRSDNGGAHSQGSQEVPIRDDFGLKMVNNGMAMATAPVIELGTRSIPLAGCNSLSTASADDATELGKSFGLGYCSGEEATSTSYIYVCFLDQV
ncbi:hypothetical protein L1987_10975 [Smallanthus sonchifolius]|uniref:Uncharacterized protein n=1 Tax=Smallanthus sonchifolius TaxID=185202 RepID=A0ACB9JBV3_9ASTR|nr:hypothetical protein L1987_10975 [Smallanthus sonchifolius]